MTLNLPIPLFLDWQTVAGVGVGLLWMALGYVSRHHTNHPRRKRKRSRKARRKR